MKTKPDLSGPVTRFLGLFITTILLLSGCKKDDHQYTPVYPEIEAETGNYVFNPGFIKQHSDSILPESWNASFDYSYPNALDFPNEGIAWDRNAQGAYYIYQRVQLKAHKYYKVSVDCDYAIRDFSPAGLYVMDSGFATILGKSEKYNEEGSQKLEFVISTEKDSVINLVLGFLNGANGYISFEHPVITKYVFLPRIQNSEFSNFLVRELRLSFSAKRFDESIQALANLVNEMLLSDIQNRTFTIPEPFRSLNSNEYPYLTSYLDELSGMDIAYCQKSSLSLGEILYNEFKIPVRQIHMQAGEIGFHQFLEYWNPYKNKWVVIDPYFGIVYEKGSTLLSTDEIAMEDLPGNIKWFADYAYTFSTEIAMEFWERTGEIETSYDPYLSLPYGDKVK